MLNVEFTRCQNGGNTVLLVAQIGCLTGEDINSPSSLTMLTKCYCQHYLQVDHFQQMKC